MAAEQLTDGLSAAELAEKAGASEEDLERMVGFGILVPGVRSLWGALIRFTLVSRAFKAGPNHNHITTLHLDI